MRRLVIAILIWLSAGIAHARECTRADFAAAVDIAGGVLREVNAENAPFFQEKLRELKAAKGWSDQEFLDNARTYVQDEQILAFDAASGQLLAEINNLGTIDSAISTPDCDLLEQLNQRLKKLIETISGKWVYMFGKLDQAMQQ